MYCLLLLSLLAGAYASNTLNVGAVHSGAATVTSLNAGSGAITTTGTLSSGAATVTSLNAGSGAITTTGTLSSGAATVSSLNAGSGTITTTGTLSSGASTITNTATAGRITTTGANNQNVIAGFTQITGSDASTLAQQCILGSGPNVGLYVSGATYFDGNLVGTDGSGNIQFDPALCGSRTQRAIFWGGGYHSKGFVIKDITAGQIRAMDGTGATDVVIVQPPAGFTGFNAVYFVETAWVYILGGVTAFTTGDSSTPSMALFENCGGTRGVTLTTASDWPWATWNAASGTFSATATNGIRGPSSTTTTFDCDIAFGPAAFSSSFSGGAAGDATIVMRLFVWYGNIGGNS